LYGFLLPKWALFDDAGMLGAGRVGAHRIGGPTAAQWVALLAGKAFFVAWLLVVPLVFHPLSIVIPFCLLTTFVTGIGLAVTFQPAHCVEEAAFPPAPRDGRMDRDFAEHPLAATVDFARGNRALAWLLGGLTFQVEHHLFPRIGHLHHPAISTIVACTAAGHGVTYRATPTLRAAVRSHHRMLRRLGRPDRTGGDLGIPALLGPHPTPVPSAPRCA